MHNRLRIIVATLAGSIVIAGLLAAGCAGDAKGSSPQPAHETESGHDPSVSTANAAKAAAFHDGMRKLWEDHITWTRLFIVSAAAGLPDSDATAGRLLQNQADIGDAIKPFYGDAAGEKLTGLLHDHILIAADLIKAAKSGDKAMTDAASARWYANADEIATFLTGANPSQWPISDTRKMMKDHLDLTLAEAVARLGGDYKADIAAYDKVHLEILTMADMLSSGIVAQYPDKFR